jgi:hypothetical protein
VLIEARAVDELVKAKLPAVHAHLASALDLPPSDLVAPWIGRCFVGAAGGLGAAARLWDCLLFEGPKVLARAALAALWLSRGAALACGHAGALPHVIEGRCARAAAPPGGSGALAAAAFSRRAVGAMPGARLAAIRAAAAAEVKAKLEERRRRLAQILGR